MSTPEEIKVGRRNLASELRQMLRRKDLDEYPLDAQMVRDLVEVLEAAEPYLTAAAQYSEDELAAKIADRVPHADLDGFALNERLRIGKAVAPLLRELLAHPEVES